MNISDCINDGLQPILLPVRANSVSTGGVASTRGIGITIGETKQLFSFKPTVQQNNTFVTNAAECGSQQNYTCIASHGGAFNTDGAQVTNNEQSWNGTSGEAKSGYTNLYFNDIFEVASRRVPGVPFFTYVNEQSLDSNPSALSFGQNSSFLRSMLANKAVGTSKWSYWPGVLGSTPANDKDGLLIMGGYDAALKGSDFTTIPMNYAASTVLPMTVTGLSWQNGTNTTSLMPSGTSQLRAYLDPYTDSITNMPKDSAIGMALASGAAGSESAGWSWSTVPSGNLIVTLSNGLKTTIPGSDIFRYRRNYTSSGQPTSSSQITQYAWYNTASPWPANQFVRFGYPFLAQYLLVVDPEQEEYHLATAVKSKGGSTAGDLQALCKDAKTSSNSPSTSSTPSKSNTAAIAGGVGGGIGGLLLLALLFFFYRRHMKKSRVQAQADSRAGAHGQPPTSQAPQVAYEPVAMASPTEKYMQTGVHEAGSSPVPQYQPYNRYSQQTYTNELASNPAMSPRSDAGHSQSATAMGSSDWGDRYSQAGTHPVSGSHELSGSFAATSGPVEMPAGDYHPRH